MAPSAQAHHRSHSLLLLQKLLNLRDKASPLTLILDNLEQSAWPLVTEYMNRAKISRTKIIFLSLSTLKKPPQADIFIPAWSPSGPKPLHALASEILSHIAPTPSPSTSSPSQKTLIIIDTLNPLSHPSPHLLPSFLGSLIPNPDTSIVATYHSDIPPLRPVSEYAPTALSVITHLSTAIFTVSSLPQAVERKKARDRSRQEPEFGLGENQEGVFVGLRRNVGSSELIKGGIVVEMEMRRKSGRAVAEKFVLFPSSQSQQIGKVMLLSDHPAFASPQEQDGEGDGEQEMEASFSLGLTEKQRRDREGVVLPYFDAQTDVGGGEGGRILYDMGREDDFDEEEDEI
ncbi:Elongator complex protein 5 [Podospora australis]|uniref:Elongator complex protein 5 n=1 Tax=Podospora australis TaxID=1536484 RepID=A0AAN7APK3_9PEZI|nr:Elongator complex protein 5 [Podospora australis]